MRLRPTERTGHLKASSLPKALRALRLFLAQSTTRYAADSLYRNSAYLMASTLTTGVFGFVFWTACARLSDAYQVGLATTIISATTLISNFSLLGFNNSLIRYLPKHDRPGDAVSTAFTITGIAAVILTGAYMIAVPFLTPQLLFIREDLTLLLSFFTLVIAAPYNLLVEAVLVAQRRGGRVLLKNLTISSMRLLLLPLFIGLGAYGVFAASSLAIAATAAVAIATLPRTLAPGLRLAIHKPVLAEFSRFSSGLYLSGFLGGLPLTVFPILITNRIGPAAAAYYYTSMAVALILYMIPMSISLSLFSEGSHDEEPIEHLIWKAARALVLMMIPAVLLVSIFGNHVLSLFGEQYSSEGFPFLRIMALSGLFLSVNLVGGAVLFVRRKIGTMIIINLWSATFILSLSHVLSGNGLSGIGLGYLAGQIVEAAIYVLILGSRGMVRSRQTIAADPNQTGADTLRLAHDLRQPAIAGTNTSERGAVRATEERDPPGA